jgi:hypothetical protein
MFTMYSLFRSPGLLKVRDPAAPHGFNVICLDERLQVHQLLVRHKGHGRAGSSHSSGPSRSVRVRYQIKGIIVVDDMAHIAEVESSTRKVRRHQVGDFLSPETLEERCPPGLFQAPREYSRPI